jgi:hypothetical protein
MELLASAQLNELLPSIPKILADAAMRSRTGRVKLALDMRCQLVSLNRLRCSRRMFA